MKGVEMSVVSFRGVNFGFWSHLGCSGQNTRDHILPRRSRFGLHAKKYKNIFLICIFFICFIYSIHIIQVFDDNVFAIIKSHCIFHLSVF